MTARTKILVVDDDPDILRLVDSILTGHGYEVTSAPNGRKALEQLRGGLVPCLILIDLEMPVISGQELRAELARDPSTRDIPVAMTSASRENLDQLGASLSRLEKPFNFPDLLRAVEEHCSPVPRGWE
jgi:CheY-like chemotaxis protein